MDRTAAFCAYSVERNSGQDIDHHMAQGCDSLVERKVLQLIRYRGANARNGRHQRAVSLEDS